MDSEILTRAIAFFKQLPAGTKRVHIELAKSAVSLVPGAKTGSVEVVIQPDEDGLDQPRDGLTINVPDVQICHYEGDGLSPPSTCIVTET